MKKVIYNKLNKFELVKIKKNLFFFIFVFFNIFNKFFFNLNIYVYYFYKFFFGYKFNNLYLYNDYFFFKFLLNIQFKYICIFVYFLFLNKKYKIVFNFYKMFFIKYYIKTFLKLNFNVFFKNKYIKSNNSYIIMKGYNLNIKKIYLSYDLFDHYTCFFKNRIFLYNILKYFFIENSFKNVKYYFKNYYLKSSNLNNIFDSYFIKFFKIKQNKKNLLNILFLNVKENYNEYVNYNYLKYNLSFNKNILKFNNNNNISLNFNQSLYILKNIFKYFSLTYKYLNFDLFILLKYINQINKFNNNFLDIKKQYLILNQNIIIYDDILFLFNINNFYIIYQLNIKYINKLSYFFNNINSNLFLNFQFLFFKYNNNYLKLNLYILYYYKDVLYNFNDFIYKYKNNYIKEESLFDNIKFLLNRLIYKFFLVLNKDFYFKNY